MSNNEATYDYSSVHVSPDKTYINLELVARSKECTKSDYYNTNEELSKNSKAIYLYELASPTNHLEITEDEDVYTEAIEGVYDKTGCSRHQDKGDNLYNHTVDSVYDHSRAVENMDNGDINYDRNYALTTEDNYDISKR